MSPMNSKVLTFKPIIKEVFDEINFCRTRPKEYAKFVEARLKFFDENGNFSEKKSDGGTRKIRTQEGTKPVKECVQYLRQVTPLPAIKSMPASLCRSAQDHVDTQG